MTTKSEFEIQQLAESWYQKLNSIHPNPRKMSHEEFEWYLSLTGKYSGLTSDEIAAIKLEIEKKEKEDKEANISVPADDVLYYPSRNGYLIAYNFTRDILEINRRTISKIKENDKIYKKWTSSALAYLCMLMDCGEYNKQKYVYYRKKTWPIKDGSLDPSEGTIEKIKNQLSGFLQKYWVDINLQKIN